MVKEKPRIKHFQKGAHAPKKPAQWIEPAATALGIGRPYILRTWTKAEYHEGEIHKAELMFDPHCSDVRRAV